MPDDNQDFNLEENEEEEESTEGEEEGSSTDDEEEENEEEDEDKKDKEGGEGTDDEIPEKFKGKTIKDVVKSYKELESMIEKKAREMATKMTGKQGKPAPVTKKETDDIMKEFEGIDFSKMKPAEFAKFIIEQSEKRAQAIARTTYDTVDQTRASVNKDIETTTKVWPQLKENEEFRDMVVAIIENEANKGEILPLKTACERVGKLMGLKAGETPKKEPEAKSRPKTGVERGTGAGGTDKETDEEKVVNGILGAGSNSTHKLGGLGI